MDEANLGFALLDGDARIRYANVFLSEMLGVEGHTLLGQQLRDYTDASHAELLDQLFEDRCRRREPFAVEWRTGTGTVTTLVSPSPVQVDDDLDGCAVFFTDISTFRPAWAELQDLARRLDDSLRSHARENLDLKSALGLLVAGSTPQAPAPPGVDLLVQLTPREREIVSDLVSGKDVTTISSVRDISPHTVRNHIKSVYRKFGVHSRMELLAALRFGAGDLGGRGDR